MGGKLSSGDNERKRSESLLVRGGRGKRDLIGFFVSESTERIAVRTGRRRTQLG